MIENILFIMFITLLVNWGLGTLINCMLMDFISSDDFGKSLGWGLFYWVIKLITLPISIKKNKKRHKNKHEQNINDRLIKSTQKAFKDFVDMDNLVDSINEIKESLSTDLYSRAVSSYGDMMSILIKCSDGEGNVDVENFGNIIKKSVEECYEVTKISWEEMKSRVDEDRKNYYKDKKESINKDLEDMINKNREFKKMNKK